MAKFEQRGNRSDDDVRIFDASDEEDTDESRLPLLVTLALLVLAMFSGIVWLAYSQGLARGRTVSPMTADGSPQPQQGFKVYEQPAPPDDNTVNQPAIPPPSGPAAPAHVERPPSPVAKSILPSPAPKAAAPTATASNATPDSGGSYVLQVGAYKSQADADGAWKAFKAKHAALLAGYNSDVQKADLGEKGTWYRLRVAGFADKDVASSQCDRLKTDGAVCFISR